MIGILDQLSTSQTSSEKRKGNKRDKDRNIYDRCSNNAPYFAYQIASGRWGIIQGCCNDWNCPRCGQQRAREEYGRIVEGSRQISQSHQLYLMTVTCKGKEEDYETAESMYLVRTNNLLTKLRAKSKRAKKFWTYASVTERQKRLHPHSHYITTYCPNDAVLLKKGEGKIYTHSTNVFPAPHDTIQSFELERACADSGLGWQYDISVISSFEAGSRYVAKYLFKETVFETVWPDGWRRVRYSQNWPKLEKKKGEAILLLSASDWHSLAAKVTVIETPDNGVRDKVERMLGYTGISIK